MEVRATEPQAVHRAAYWAWAQLKELKSHHHRAILLFTIWHSLHSNVSINAWYCGLLPFWGRNVAHIPAGIGSAVCPRVAPRRSTTSRWLSCDSHPSGCSRAHCHEVPPTPLRTSCMGWMGVLTQFEEEAPCDRKEQDIITVVKHFNILDVITTEILTFI